MSESNLIRRAEAIFDAIADLPESARAAEIGRLASGDAALMDLVQRLVASDIASAGFLETPARAVDAALRSLDRTARELPTAIGDYRVVSLIGEGGMGAVYEAQQENPRRAVAVKVIRAGAASPESLARFRREAQLLGALHHAGIAAIYEAGHADVVYPSGTLRNQPYFAMEYVRGEGLSDYLLKHSPSLRDRLELFAKVCDAVDHAHRAGIVHRDLKPGNILVERAEGGPAPKILDFGVARVEHSNANTLRTDALQLVGTVPYMSPEQISPQSDGAVDARSDVYSLGVILYQVLSGKLPYDLSNRSLADAARIVQDEEPASLSTTNRAYRGDLATIVARALEKDPARRYQSAAQFADDIRRSLRHEPITARPPTTAYQLSKFARRNRAVVAGVVATMLALSVGTVASTIMYFRAESDRLKAVDLAKAAQDASDAATKAKSLAESESKKVTAINDYLLADFIGAAAPSRDGHEVKLLTVLVRAAENVGERFKDEPLLEAEIRLMLASALGDIDLRADAIRHARIGRERMAAAVGPDDDRSLRATVVYCNELSADQQHQENEATCREAIARFEKLLPPENTSLLRCRALLGESLQAQGRYGEAEEILLPTIAQMEASLGRNDDNTMATISSLVAVYKSTGRHEDAIRVQEDLLRRCESSPACGKMNELLMRSNLLGAFLNLGRIDEAVPHAEALATEIRKYLPEGHFYRAQAMVNAGAVFSRAKRFDEAISTLLEAFEGMRASRGDGAWETERVASILRNVYARKGDDENAIKWIPLTFSHRLLAAGDDEIESLTKGIGEVHNRLSPYGLESQTVQLLTAGGDKLAPLNSPRRARYFANLARACTSTGRRIEAREALAAAKEALSYSAKPDVDGALIESITISE
ncbi:MAG: protein kinase domain-containing protein [Phycisphaerales bacterium]